MGDVVNLNQYRKKRDRHRRKHRAAESRVKHGLTGNDKALLKDQRARDVKLLDDRRMDDRRRDDRRRDAGGRDDSDEPPAAG